MPLALIDLIPPSGIPVGPLTIGFYGVSFIVAVVVMILVSQSEARRKGIDPGLVSSAIIVVAVFAIIGARLYHVIDDWHLYADDPLRAVLPPYSGLGLYGGILGAMVGIWVFLRGRDIPFWRALDIVVPGTLLAQGIARWGNFFNQELYGPATDLPWAIAIDCAHRIEPYGCSQRLPARWPARTGHGGLPPAVLLRVGAHHHRRAHRPPALSSLRLAPAGRRPGLVLDDLVRHSAPHPGVVPRGLELDHPGRAHGRAHRRRPHHRRRGHHRLAPSEAAACGCLIGLPALAVAQGPTAAGRS